MVQKVLVFESDAAFASELRSELGKLGCSVTVVDDGNAGLQQAAADKPELILLAIELPRMNGFSVCNKLKKDASLKEVPLIIMSSESSDETFEQHRKLRTRAEDYVHKPISFAELRRRIEAFVALGGEVPPTEAPNDDIVIDEEVTLNLDTSQAVEIAAARRASVPASPDTSVDVDHYRPDAFAARGADDERVRELEAALAAAREEAAQVRQAAEEQAARAERDTQEQVARAREELQRTHAEDLLKYKRISSPNLSDGEAERLRREVEDLKNKLTSASKPGAVSSREFLDLREALNKKDKEILSLKEALGKKDKEIIDAKDKLLALERANADLDDKVLAGERELADLREKVDVLTRDREQAKKLAEDVKVRLQRAQTEADARGTELNQLKERIAADQAAAEAKLAAVRQESAEAIEAAEARHAAATSELQERAEDSLRTAETRHMQSVAELEQRHAAERARQAAEAADEKDSAIQKREAELRSESDSKLAALHRAHQDELARAKTDFEQKLRAQIEEHDEEKTTLERRQIELLANAEQRHSEAMAGAEARRAADIAQTEERYQRELASLTARHADELQTLRRETDARVTQMETTNQAKMAELTTEHEHMVDAIKRDAVERIAAAERDRDTRVGAAEAKAQKELAEMRAVAEAQRAASEEQRAELDFELSENRRNLSERDRELKDARERVGVLETNVSSLRSELETAMAKISLESNRAQKAVAKWEADRESLERAKDALAVVLSQIEETETRRLAD